MRLHVISELGRQCGGEGGDRVFQANLGYTVREEEEEERRNEKKEKEWQVRGWKDGLAVNNTECSSRGPRFKSHHGSSQLFVAPFPEDLIPSHRHTCKQNTNSHKFFKNFYKICKRKEGEIRKRGTKKRRREGGRGRRKAEEVLFSCFPAIIALCFSLCLL